MFGNQCSTRRNAVQVVVEMHCGWLWCIFNAFADVLLSYFGYADLMKRTQLFSNYYHEVFTSMFLEVSGVLGAGYSSRLPQD